MEKLDGSEDYSRVFGGDDVFLLPGLVESHTHLRYENDLTLYLASGVTTVRNMEGAPRHLSWRDEIAGGRFGPRILTAGPVTYQNAQTRLEVDQAVDSIFRLGYDFLKVFDPLPAQNFDWLVDAAGRVGLPISGHIPRAVGGRAVFRAGSHQTVEHAEQFVYHWFYDDLDRSRIPELVEEVKQSGSAVTPTLQVIHSWIQVADSPDILLALPERRWLHPETLAFWHTFSRPSSFENRLIADIQEEVVLELARREIPLLAGSDAYMVGLVGPWGLLREMEAMEIAGLTRFEVLRAATATPARVFGYNSGLIEEGRSADLILVRGNPLENLAVLKRPSGVMMDGIWHPQGELEERLTAVAAAYLPGSAFVDGALGGRADAALSAYRRAARENPANGFDVSLITYVASILRQRGRLQDALTLYEVALEEDPENAAVYEGLARTFLGLGRVREAEVNVRRALESDPFRTSATELLRSFDPSP